MSAFWRRANSVLPDPRAMPLDRREIVQAAGLLVAVLALFFAPALVPGRVLLPADLIYDLDPLWQPLAPPGYAGPSNHILSDQVYQFYPWKTFLLRWVRRGVLPLWNPHMNGGQPFLGNAQSGVFDPLRWLGYLPGLVYPPLEDACFVITALARLYVAGIFTYLLARQLGMGKAGAALSMICFPLSGPMVGWVGYPLASVIAWLPATLWAGERVIASGQPGTVLACGLIIGLQFLGGHPETSALLLLVWGAYCAWRVATATGLRARHAAPHIIRLIGCGALGAALSVVQTLPFVDALLQSAILPARQIESAARASSLLTRVLLEWHEWPTLVTALLPDFFGTPRAETYIYPYSNYLEQNIYVGVLPFALAVSATWSALRRPAARHPSTASRPRPRAWPVGRHRQVVLLFALLAACSLAVAVRMPLFNAINYLPLLRISANGRLRLAYALAISMLAGFGLDDIVSGASMQPLRRALIVITAGSVCLLAAGYAGLGIFETQIVQLGRDYIDARLGSPYYSQSREHYDALVQQRVTAVKAGLFPGSVVTYAPLWIPLAWSVLRRFGPKALPRRHSPGAQHRRRALGLSAIALTLTDGFVHGVGFNPTLSADRVFPTPDAVAFLQSHSALSRVCATDLVLYPNSAMIYGLFDVRGYESIVPERYANLIDRLDGHFRFRTNSLFVEVSSPLLDLLGVEYALTDRTAPSWQQVYQGAGTVRVYHNSAAMPRAFVVYDIQVVTSPTESLQLVTTGKVDLRQTAVLEQLPDGWQAPDMAPIRLAHVQVTRYTPNRVQVQVRTDNDGILVLTDAYDRGWKAYLDGRAVRVYAVNLAVRGVVIPSGTHTVSFVYRPASFVIGACISLGSAALCIALYGWMAYARRHRA